MFLGINMFWSLAARAKMSLAQNIFMPANINSIVTFWEWSGFCAWLNFCYFIWIIRTLLRSLRIKYTKLISQFGQVFVTLYQNIWNKVMFNRHLFVHSLLKIVSLMWQKRNQNFSTHYYWTKRCNYLIWPKSCKMILISRVISNNKCLIYLIK